MLLNIVKLLWIIILKFNCNIFILFFLCFNFFTCLQSWKFTTFWIFVKLFSSFLIFCYFFLFLFVVKSNRWNWPFIYCLSIFLHLIRNSWTKIISTINTYFVLMFLFLNLVYFFRRNASFFHIVKRITIEVMLFHTAIFLRRFNFFTLIFLL